MLTIHTNSINSIYPCSQCMYKAPTNDYLKAHVEYKHEGIYYACKYCNIETKTKCSLKRHFESVHSNECPTGGTIKTR